MTRLVSAFLFGIMLATPMQADPSPQLVALVQSRLGDYNIDADVSQFATPTVAQLYAILLDNADYIDTRNMLLSVLRKPKYK